MAEEAVKLVLFLILITVIDTGACILGLEAAVRGHKLRCGESTVSVWILVLGAALLLVTAQLLASWVSGDLDGPEAIRDRQLTRTCLAFSW